MLSAHLFKFQRVSPPALVCAGEVFLCYRCRRGGNQIILSNDLGLFQNQNSTPKERRQYARKREQGEREARRFKTWLASFRAKQVFKFQIAVDFGIYLHRRAHQILSSGGIVDSDTTASKALPMSPEWTLRGVAGPTGLEPATSDVTGQRSNQLNYDPAKYYPKWWAVLVSNQRPHPCKGCALPPELTAL
jgi:hypothetical protein